MKDNPNLENDGQFKLDLQDGSELIANSDNEQHEDVTHLSPDDLIELEATNPDEYQALMAEIEKKFEMTEKQKELEEIEKRIKESEIAENVEKNEIIRKQKEDALRVSIAKAYDNRGVDNDKETACGDIYDKDKYAKIIAEQIKAKEEQRRKWWQSKKRHKK